MGCFDDFYFLAGHTVAVARDDHALYRDIPVSLDGRRHRTRRLARSDNDCFAFWRRREMCRHTIVRQSRRRVLIEHITEAVAAYGRFTPFGLSPKAPSPGGRRFDQSRNSHRFPARAPWPSDPRPCRRSRPHDVEKLLRRCRVGQGDAQRPRALKARLNPSGAVRSEARIEGALDHPLAVHFQNLRGGKAAHQRFAHLGRIGAGLGGEQQRFGHGLDVQRDDDLIGDLGVCPSPLPPTSVMFLPISLEQRLDLLERAFAAAHHDRQCRVFRADLAAGNRRIEILAAELVDLLGESLRLDRRDRAHVDHESCRAQPFGAMPSAPNKTYSTSGVSGTMVMMMSAFCATSLAPLFH